MWTITHAHGRGIRQMAPALILLSPLQMEILILNKMRPLSTDGAILILVL